MPDEIWTPAQYQAYLAGHTLGSHPGVPPLDADAPEDVLRGRIQQLCKEQGLLYYHALKSQGSTAGFPDFAILAPEGGILNLWEGKARTGIVSPAQRQWLEALTAVTAVDVRVVQPSDWSWIHTFLTRRPA